MNTTYVTKKELEDRIKQLTILFRKEITAAIEQSEKRIIKSLTEVVQAAVDGMDSRFTVLEYDVSKNKEDIIALRQAQRHARIERLS